MPHSSCLCGAIQITFTGAPVFQFMCSCLDDRKITGSLFGATNLMIPTAGLETTHGTLHTFSKVVESGADMTSYLCANCGSTLYRVSSGYPGVVMMKAGCIDSDGDNEDGSEGGFDVESGKPAVELFSRSHVKWVPEIEGVQHNHAG